MAFGTRNCRVSRALRGSPDRLGGPRCARRQPTRLMWWVARDDIPLNPRSGCSLWPSHKVHTRTEVSNRQTTTEVLTMGITHSTVSPHRSVDATGRALPMTVEEIHAQAVEIARGLDALDDMGDEEEQRQTLDALMKAIDEEPLSPRRRFRQRDSCSFCPQSKVQNPKSCG